MPGKIARIGILSPQLSYNREIGPALEWNTRGELTILPGTQLVLPFLACGEPSCEFFISFSQESGRDLSVIYYDQIVNLNQFRMKIIAAIDEYADEE